ncbi:MAG: hypothetical protein NC548_52120, partial [Lachnospiraceae bacterium]|nr:hypothetical protein [Lachnospiraceae bacterium]
MTKSLRNFAVAALLATGVISTSAAVPGERQGDASRKQRTAADMTVSRGSERSLPPSRVQGTDNGFFSPVTAVNPPAAKKTAAFAAESAPVLKGVTSYTANNKVFTHSRVTIPVGSTDLQYTANYFDLEGPRMAHEVDGIVYVHDRYDWGNVDYFIYGYDANGEQVSFQFADATLCGLDLTQDPTTGVVYALATTAGETGYTLSRFEYTAGKVSATPIAPIGLYYAIAADSKGQLYVIDKKGDLFKMNKTNGNVTKVGSTGFIPYYVSSATIDPATDRMFWSVSPEDGSGILVEVNLQTGAGTLLCSYPDRDTFVGLEAVVEISDAAPAAVSSLTADFEQGALSGNVCFNLPATSTGGSQLSGTLDYVLNVGDRTLTGQGTPGATITKSVTMPASGMYTISAFASNSSGKGPITSINQYIGVGTPKAPQSVTATAASGKVTVSWEPVTESAEGGYVNPAEITYIVKRGDNVIASNISGTEYVDNINTEGVLEHLVYSVSAQYKDAVSKSANSNALLIGSATLPWNADFDNADLSDFTVIDANADGKTWILSENYAKVDYNSFMDMDDWLICPPMKMEAGKMYELALSVGVIDGNYPERFEVKMGNAPSAQAMTATLVAPTEITNTDPVTYTAEIRTDADGTYYIAVHGISVNDRYQLRIFDISVSDGKLPVTPSPVENLVAAATAPFALSANISMKAPSTQVNGDALETLDRVVINRDGSVIKTFENLAPGQELNFTDQVETAGLYRYSAVAFLGENSSVPVSTMLYLGPTVPAKVANVKISETTPGSVQITWDAVTTDLDGNPIPTDAVEYLITDIDGKTVTLKDTKWSTTVCSPNQQTFASFAIAAQTEAGIGEVTSIEMIAVGVANKSLRESFSDGKTHYNWATQATQGEPQWSLGNEMTMQDVGSVDADNGFLYMVAQHTFDAGELLSAKFSITEQTSQFSFWTYNVPFNTGSTDDNVITIDVREAGGEWTEVFSESVYHIADGVPGWAKAIVDLTPFIGKDVQIRLSAQVLVAAYTIFDDFRLSKPHDVDFAVGALSAPERVEADKTFEITASLLNEGLKTAEGLTLNLYADNVLVDSKEIPATAPTMRTNVTFSTKLPTIAIEAVKYSVEVKGDADENAANNTAECEVRPLHSNLPWVKDLHGNNEDGAANLEWSAPDLSRYVEPITESFESGNEFA